MEAGAKEFLKASSAPGRRHVLLSTLAGLGVTLGTILEAYAFASVIYLVVVEKSRTGEVLGWFAVFAAAMALKVCFTYLSGLFGAEGALRVQRGVRRRILDRLFLEDRGARPRATAPSANALIEEVDRLESYYARYYPQLLLSVLSPLLILLAVFPASPVAGLILLLAVPFIPLNMALIGMGTEAVSHRQLEALRDLSGYFLDRLQGLATLRRLGYAGRELENIEAASGELGRRTMSVLRIAFLSSAVLEFFSTFGIAIVATYIGLVLLGYLHLGVGSGGMSLRVGFFILLLAPAYFKPLRTFAAAYHDRADALAAARNLALLATPTDAPRYPERSTGQEVPPLSPLTSVEFSEVTVRFDGRERPALFKVNLALGAGEKVAVTGPSGAGKSTLLEVVAGQVSPSEGDVLVDGRNLELVPVARWRQSTCWIGQRPYLFPGTIAQNISLGQPERSREEVEAAARLARVLDFAVDLPAGLDAGIGERGTGLSGGEAQRVALARAFLKDTPLLLLDEPTAHLDAENEAALVETIAEPSEGRTVLIATHSPALIDLCDRAVHLEGGVLKEAQLA